MPDLLGWLVLVAGTLVASVVGGVAGFGAGIVMLPNLSRIWWSRGEIDRAVVVRFALGAAFLVLSVPFRHLLASSHFRMRLRHFPILGA